MSSEPDVWDPALAVEQVLATVRGTSITELEVDWGEGSLRLTRESAGAAPTVLELAPEGVISTEAQVTSAHVGIFHRDAAKIPGPGDWVAAGSPLGEIETLGIRNSVTASAAGVIAEILVEDGTPVEYGQPLVIMRPAPEPPPAAGP